MPFFPLACRFTTFVLDRNQNIEFFHFLAFPYLFAAVIDLLGLLPVQKRLRNHHRDGHFFRHGVATCSGKSFAPSSFPSIFVHISGSIEPITLIWASLERSFPPAEVKRSWLKPLYQSEAWCITIHMKMSLIYM